MEDIIDLFKSNIGKFNMIDELDDGLNNKIYLINDLFIWKVFKNKNLFDSETEKYIMNQLDQYEVYYYDENNICYKYSNGNSIDRVYFKSNLDKVMSLAGKFNSYKLDIKNFWYDIIPKWLNILLDEELDVIYQEICLELTEVSSEDDIVLCHHDIHSGNIIKNRNKLVLIDLECSFNNYFFVEIGNIICEVYTDYDNENYTYEEINEDVIKSVQYLYDYKIATLEQIKMGIKISHFYWCVWGFLLDKNNDNSDFDYKNFALIRKKFINFVVN